MIVSDEILTLTMVFLTLSTSCLAKVASSPLLLILMSAVFSWTRLCSTVSLARP